MQAPEETAAENPSRFDWVRAAELVRAGQLSNRAIAAQIGCSEGALRKQIKKNLWKPDLASEVKKRVRERLVREPSTRSASREPEPPDLRTDEEIVEEAAESAIRVVRQHRAALNSAQHLAAMLFEELRSTTREIVGIEEAIDESGVSELKRSRMHQAVSLPARAGVLRDLAGAMQRFQTMERTAWGLNSESEPPPPPLENLGDDQLRARIMLLVTQVDLPAEAIPQHLRKMIEHQA